MIQYCMWPVARSACNYQASPGDDLCHVHRERVDNLVYLATMMFERTER